MTLRLGYLPNVTHAPAIVGLQNGTFAKDLGSNVDLKTSDLQLGHRRDDRAPRRRARRRLRRPEPRDQRVPEVERHADPHRRRHRLGRRVPRREAVDHERGRPQGQEARDAVARQHPGRRAAQLAEVEGSRARRPTGGGDVSIVPQDNSTTVTAFQTGAIDGAWVPEPYATKLEKAGGKVLVNEADLWPRRQVRHDEARRDHQVPRRPPRHRVEPAEGAVELDRPHQEQPDPGRAARLGRDRSGHRQGARRRRSWRRRSRASPSRSTRSPRR